MEGEKGASTYGATLHWHWTWRVADSFSCLGSDGLTSDGRSSSVCNVDVLTFIGTGQAATLWSALPHLRHRLFSQQWFISSGFNFPSGPSSCLCGQGAHRLVCQVG